MINESVLETMQNESPLYFRGVGCMFQEVRLFGGGMCKHTGCENCCYIWGDGYGCPLSWLVKVALLYEQIELVGVVNFDGLDLPSEEIHITPEMIKTLRGYLK